MKVYAISFRFGDNTKSHMELYDALKKLGDYYHGLDYLWYIRTDTLTAIEISDILMPYIDKNNDVFVINLVDPSDTGGWFFKSYWEYIKYEK
jgi:hypothetical protein